MGVEVGGEGIGAGSAQIVELLEEVESILLLSASYRELGGEGEGSSAGACHALLCVRKGDPDLILSFSPQLSSVSLLRWLVLLQLLLVLLLNTVFFAKSHEGGSYRCVLTATTAAVAGTAAGAVVGAFCICHRYLWNCCCCCCRCWCCGSGYRREKPLRVLFFAWSCHQFVVVSGWCFGVSHCLLLLLFCGCRCRRDKGVGGVILGRCREFLLLYCLPERVLVAQCC